MVTTVPKTPTTTSPQARSPLTDFDLYLFNEGTHVRVYQKLGAHLTVADDGTHGVFFSVWAPSAEAVSVIGDFNSWDWQATPLQNRGSSGIWEGFVPNLDQGTLYKYSIKPRTSWQRIEKADPYGFASELRPLTASVVWDLDRYTWQDDSWIAQRRERQSFQRPISIYEVHLGSWKRVPETNGFLTYRDLGQQVADYCHDMGYTHVELLPISEHPFDPSWGYQTVGYYAPTSRFGTPDDFKAFVDILHQAGIGVLLDWVPAHFPRDPHGLAWFDGSALYEHADPRQGEHPDWGTKVFNYGRHEVRSFLLSNAVFWVEEYHIDGLRVDAVASMLYLDYSRQEGEWIPNQYGGRENLDAISFLQRMNEVVHTECPGVLTIAEESTAWPQVTRPPYMGGLGFSLKWNMGWMHDTLEYISKEPVHRRWHHHDLTFSLLYAFHENFVLPLSHDEVVHGKASLLHKVPGDPWQQFATLRLLFAYMWGHPGKKLLFQGSDFGQGDEWTEAHSVDWHLLQWPWQRGLQRCVADLNRLYRAEGSLHQVDFDWRGFEWLESHDNENSVFAFLRRGLHPDDCLVVVCNFTPVPRERYSVGVPYGGGWREVLNTDAEMYGGGNIGNGGHVWAIDQPSAGRPHTLCLTVPPLGAVYLKPDR
ncbi:MAG TPA: 1,4-alpha-glucan branching protein GlgB [Chloroflexota bacterium]|jgi:1,4-alpha-glucan branching enzyme|nr:1,4-alpha-glucan branching protein GlgB [Chloroflexota bacterium]